ncbi:hypothetical protein NC653_024367 [Populus alba x Populus x berolinensis]|uniref:Uncharacterized protein n=1 Tax=Populus alba x Populus x berolinensis TaxID=444605 RepID=A0AAD6Q6Q3_9ROSI|nr:hypothetical protein NC653_024367 [Populus alba x Populus x berolinensis]
MALANMPEKIEAYLPSGCRKTKIEGSSLNVPEESKRSEKLKLLNCAKTGTIELGFIFEHQWEDLRANLKWTQLG